MKERISNNSRKWLSLIIAIFLYYIIHEGSHVIVAILYGVFEKIRILGLGVQVVAKTELLTDFQTAMFCVVGSISTLLVSYLLVLFVKKIVDSKNKILKAICYYTTLAFMLLDPIYLTILYKFVGGGDMNGILLFGIPEIVVQLIYGIIAIINIFLIIKKIYPAYKKSFSE
ncbi:MAG: hypothetical protein NC483_01280 [Ruminococcus sp.]|nr:hypothetical protein [Ruminococcus sp.]